MTDGQPAAFIEKRTNLVAIPIQLTPPNKLQLCSTNRCLPLKITVLTCIQNFRRITHFLRDETVFQTDHVSRLYIPSLLYRRIQV